MAAIHHLIRIAAKPEDVFRALSEPEGIAGWFTRASCDLLREGGALELEFPDGRVGFRITEWKAPARVTWHCTSPDNPWFGTDVRFEVVAREGRSVVRFDHDGWPEVTDLFRDCSMSWAYFLESLRALIEDGEGTPEIFESK